jgi:hypothetical protein
MPRRRFKRFIFIAAVAMAAGVGASTDAADTAAAPRALVNQPVCPFDGGYSSYLATDQVPAEQWGPLLTTFQQAVAYGRRYAMQRRHPSETQTSKLEDLLPGEAWKQFSVDRITMRPSKRRYRITGGYVTQFLGGPCLNSQTGRIWFEVRLTPRFYYRGKKVKGLLADSFLFLVRDGQLFDSYLV